MPTYQYACTECADRSEVVQRFTDEPLKVCSVCGGKLRKVFSPVGIVFKGSGFYRTDSRNGSSTVPAASSESNGSAADSKSSSSSDKTGSSASTDSSSSSGSSASGSSGSSGSGGSKSSQSSGAKKSSSVSAGK